MHILSMMSQGLDMAPLALFLNRVTLGVFYFLARFRFFYDPSKPPGWWTLTPGGAYRKSHRWLNAERHASLINKMKHCGFCRAPRFWAWTAAIIEVFGGIALVLGVLSTVAAVGLLGVTLFATRCTWRTKIFEQNPADLVDCASCYLWRVEGLYIVMALAVILGGPGAFTLGG